MSRDDVIGILCGLVTEVGCRVYDNEFEHDCFCDLSPDTPASIHPKVVDFILHATHKAIDAL